MTNKQILDLYNSLEKRISQLEVAILNHCGTHRIDRVMQGAILLVMTIVVLLLKFKIL